MKDTEKAFNQLNKTLVFFFFSFYTLVFYIKNILYCLTSLKKVIFVTYFTKKERKTTNGFPDFT